MRTVIVGCGRVGAMLAAMLDDGGHQVTILDTSTAAFDRLPSSFRGSALRGDGTPEEGEQFASSGVAGIVPIHLAGQGGIPDIIGVADQQRIRTGEDFLPPESVDGNDEEMFGAGRGSCLLRRDGKREEDGRQERQDQFHV